MEKVEVDLKQETVKALRGFFLSSLRNLPADFSWDYGRVSYYPSQKHQCGCAIVLAGKMGIGLSPIDIAEELNLPQIKVHRICYRLHEELAILVRHVTAEMVADAFEDLYSRHPV